MTHMHDVVVVGGGPVGLATALHAASANLDVVVLEPRSAPIDKACGEGLMPRALRELELLGVHPQGMPFRGIRYVDARGASVCGEFVDEPGRGVRRTELHRSLAQRVADVGVPIVPERVVDVGSRDDVAAVVTASGRRWLARHVVAADGLHSLVRRRAGLQGPRSVALPRRYGIRRHVMMRPWSDLVEVHWGAGAEAYVTPVAEDCVGVAVLTSHPASWAELLAQFPTLSVRVDSSPLSSEQRGAGPLRQSVVARRRGRVLFVGDAAGYVDALTGEGLAVGFVSARLAIEAISTKQFGQYDAWWRSATRASRWGTEAMVRAASTRFFRDRLVTTAAAHPRAFTAAVRSLA